MTGEAFVDILWAIVIIILLIAVFVPRESDYD